MVMVMAVMCDDGCSRIGDTISPKYNFGGLAFDVIVSLALDMS